MQALIANREQPGTIEFRDDHPQPKAGPGEVLIRVHLAGICSTDLEIVRGYMGFRGVPGHEFVGTVEEGPATLRERRVVAEINCAPPRVTGVNAGARKLDDDTRKHLPGRTVIGILGRDGAFAERLVVPAENCHVVPDAVPDRHAVFVEPLAAACQVLRDHPVSNDTRATVIGTGRLGILCAQVLANAGCALQVLGRNEHTIALCRRLGLEAGNVDESPPRADRDLVVDCTGTADGLRLAMRIVRPRGTIVLKSTYAQPPTIDLAPIVIHEVTVAGNRCGPFAEALRLLERGAVQVEPLISRTYPLSQGVEAFAAAADRANVKVLLSAGGG